MHPKRNLKIQIVQYLGGLIEDYTGNIFVKKYASNEQRKLVPDHYLILHSRILFGNKVF